MRRIVTEPPLIDNLATLSTLEDLLDLARSAAEDPLPRVIESAAAAIARASRYRVVVIGLYRPQHDDFETTLVHGPRQLDDAIWPPPLAREILRRLPARPGQPVPRICLLTGEPGHFVGWSKLAPLAPRQSGHEDAWRSENLLLMALQNGDGQPLGLVSLEEPVSGLRPSDDDLRRLRVIASYAEQVLRTAMGAEQVESDRRMLARLSEVSTRLSECGDREHLYRLLADTVTADLAFERCSVYAIDGPAQLRRMLTHGSEPPSPLPAWLSVDQVRSLLSDELELSGTWLLAASELLGPSAAPRSRRDGRDPLAWRDHCLLTPWFDVRGELAGAVVAEDPCDQLIPRQERRRALRQLTDLAASVEHAIVQRARLGRLAGRDVLTGLRNRRGLDELIEAAGDCTVLVCDIDGFKGINDRHGHEVGDRVLERFAEVLREQTRPTDAAVRLGGDEFCVVLRCADPDGAVAAAERIRAATRDRIDDLVGEPVTVSIGLAQRTGGTPEVRALLIEADQALYRAKRTGRDRIVAATAPSAPPPADDAPAQAAAARSRPSRLAR